MKFMRQPVRNRVRTIAITPINISPLNNAYTEANILAPVVESRLTGPMPPRIMDASSRESIQLNPAIQWYPDTPENKAVATRRPAVVKNLAILLIKTDNGACLSCFSSDFNNL
jgi:hypothetical protein